MKYFTKFGLFLVSGVFIFSNAFFALSANKFDFLASSFVTYKADVGGVRISESILVGKLEDKFTDTAHIAVKEISSRYDSAKNFLLSNSLENFISSFGNKAFYPIFSLVKNVIDDVSQTSIYAWKITAGKVQSISQELSNVANEAYKLANAGGQKMLLSIGGAGNSLSRGVKNANNYLGKVSISAGRSFVDVAVNILNGVDKVKNNIGKSVVSLSSGVVNSGALLTNALLEDGKSAIGQVSQSSIGVWSEIKNIYSGATFFVNRSYNFSKSSITSIAGGAGNITSQVLDSASKFLGDTKNAIIGFIGDAAAATGEFVGDNVSKISKTIGNISLPDFSKFNIFKYLSLDIFRSRQSQLPSSQNETLAGNQSQSPEQKVSFLESAVNQLKSQLTNLETSGLVVREIQKEVQGITQIQPEKVIQTEIQTVDQSQTIMAYIDKRINDLSNTLNSSIRNSSNNVMYAVGFATAPQTSYSTLSTTDLTSSNSLTINSGGYISVGGNHSGILTVTNNANNYPNLVLQASSGQTQNLVTAKNSSGTNVATLDPSGNLTVNNLTAASLTASSQTVSGNFVISASSSNPALQVAQTGSGKAIRILGPDSTKYFEMWDDGTNMRMQTNASSGQNIIIHPDGGTVYLNTNLVVSGGAAQVTATGRANFTYDPTAGTPALWLSTSSSYPDNLKTYFVINPTSTIAFDRFMHFKNGNTDELILDANGNLTLGGALTVNGTGTSTIAGNLLISGTSTTSGNSLVNGALRLYGSSSGYVGLSAPATSTSTSYTFPASDGNNGQVLVTNGSGALSWGTGSQWTTSGSNIYYSSGNVGIGTSTPASLLTVGATGGFQVNSSGTITNGTWNGGVLSTSYGGTGTSTAFTSGSVVFAGTSGIYNQNNSNLFWDNTNGRLGIGTSTPSTLLDVNGASTFRGNLTVSGGTVNNSYTTPEFRLTTTADGVYSRLNRTAGDLLTQYNKVSSGNWALQPAASTGVSSSYGSVSNSTDFYFTGDFTILVWVKFNAFNTYYWQNVFVSQDQGSGPSPKWIFSYNPVSSQTQLDINQSTSIVGNTWTPLTGVWYQLGIKRSGNNWTFYRNGATDGTVTNSAAPQNVGAPLALGYSESFVLAGILDEVRIYKGTALSDAQVSQYYNSGSGTYNELTGATATAWWHLDEGSGVTFNDSSVNGHNGSFVGTPTWQTGIVQGAVSSEKTVWSSQDGNPYTGGLNTFGNTSSDTRISGSRIGLGLDGLTSYNFFVHSSSTTAFTADRTFLIDLNNSDRTLTISGSTNALNQDLRTTASPSFAGLTLSSPLSVGNGGTGTSTAFTAGSVVFAGTSGIYNQNNSNLFWDNTNGRLGISTSTPQTALDVAGTVNLRGASGLTGLYVNSNGNVGIGTTAPVAKFDVVGTTDLGSSLFLRRFSSDTSGAAYFITKARGTEASPATIVSGDTLGAFVWRGYDGSSYIDSDYILAVSDGTIGSNRVPSHLSFYVHPDSTSALTEVMRIANNGNMGIGTSTPSTLLDVNGTATIRGATTITSGGLTIAKGGGNLLVGTSTASGLITASAGTSTSTPIFYGHMNETATSTVIFKLVTDVNSPNTTVFKVSANGQIWSTAGTSVLSPADLAERTAIIGDISNYSNGDLVRQSPNENFKVEKTSQQYDEAMYGVVTDRGIFLGSPKDLDGSNSVKITIAGYVKVKITGDIKLGDPLTSSDLPGVAMKAVKSGRIIGFARESHAGANIDLIEAVIEPTYYPGDPNAQLSVNSSNAKGQGLSMSSMTINGNLVVYALADFEGGISGPNFTLDQSGKLVVGSIETGDLTVKNSNVNKTGITIFDRGTGNAYCVFMDFGVLHNQPGPCSSASSTPQVNLNTNTQQNTNQSNVTSQSPIINNVGSSQSSTKSSLTESVSSTPSSLSQGVINNSSNLTTQDRTASSSPAQTPAQTQTNSPAISSPNSAKPYLSATSTDSLRAVLSDSTPTNPQLSKKNTVIDIQSPLSSSTSTSTTAATSTLKLIK